MCGLFGLVRSTQCAHPGPASRVFAELGRLAEERGRDAAGFALVQPRLPVAVVKATRPFGEFWQADHGRLLDRARVVLGHTRHASQGAADRLANAHPLEAGSLAGTVNSNIDAEGLRARLPDGLPTPRGETDSEVLLLALNRVSGDLGAICEVLAAARGPAALAWVDRAKPGLVFLARGALCPLVIAQDAQGHLHWGSSPTWFQRLDEHAEGQLGFQVERVPEGTVLVIATNSAAPTVVARQSFTPTARAGDERRLSIWAGLDPREVALFQAEARHRIAPAAGPTHVLDEGEAVAPPSPDPRRGAITKGLRP